MKRLLQLLFFLIIASSVLFLNAQCRSNNVNPKSEAVLECFGIKIPQNPHCFIIIPNYSCSGCVQRTWGFINKHDLSDGYTIIDSYCSGHDPYITEIGCTVVIDSCMIVDNNAPDIANPTIVHSYKGKIKSIVSIRADAIEEMLEIALLKNH